MPFESPFEYRRFPTRTVFCGQVAIGGEHPIRIQSMCSSPTLDTDTVVQETIDLYNAGCEIVRVSVPKKSEAENLKNIYKKLKLKKCPVPIVADVHFSPSIAMIAVEYADKVRINPGNFVDKKKFQNLIYNDQEYEEELQRVQDSFYPLLKRAKELGRSLRIGTNHGSLSDRIMSRYGDTPLGMVESAIEFLKLACDFGFYDIVVSMKASNPSVMIDSYRLLISRFKKEKMNFPLHLGVTEAGDGQDGRIRSALGIGSLLDDGIGDTIRVSLTEDSIEEIPVAKEIAERYNRINSKQNVKHKIRTQTTKYPNYTKSRAALKSTPAVADMGAILPVKIIYPIHALYGTKAKECHTLLSELKEKGADMFLLNEEFAQNEIANDNDKVTSNNIIDFLIKHGEKCKPLPLIVSPNSVTKKLCIEKSLLVKGIWIDLPLLSLTSTKDILVKENESYDLDMPFIFNFVIEKDQRIDADTLNLMEKQLHQTCRICDKRGMIFTLQIKRFFYESYKLQNEMSITGLFRYLAEELYKAMNDLGVPLPPMILQGNFLDATETLYGSAIHTAATLSDGIGSALLLSHQNIENPKALLQLSLDLLQACRLRISKTDYISCPSCARTLFDLKKTTADVKRKTEHLTGVKIAVMGCIVNGPGEMADADFGYVGAVAGKIDLYAGREVVKKNIPSENAIDELVALIKESGRWKNPPI